MAGREEGGIVAGPAVDGPDGMDDPTCGKVAGIGCDGLTGGQAVAVCVPSDLPAGVEDRGAAAPWMAPSTPPPPIREELAALTIASTSCAVMSPRTRVTDGIAQP